MIFLKYAGVVILGAVVASMVGREPGRNFPADKVPPALSSQRFLETMTPRVPKKMNCPFKDGWIKKSFAPRRSLCGPRGGFDIYGTDSVVVSATDGIVQSIMTIEDVKAIMIRTGPFFYVYSNLDTVFFKKRDTVKAGAVLGLSQMKDVDFIVSDEKGRMRDKIAAAVDCKCVVVDFQFASPTDTSLEDRALGEVFRLKEVREKDQWIDSVSRHQDRISLMIVQRPTARAPYFWIQAGYYRDDKFASFFDYHVNVDGRSLKVSRSSG